MCCAAAVFYLIGAFGICYSRHTRRWIIMFVIEILLDAVLGQLVLGWGYGYILYGMMLVPIVYYFFYLDNQTQKTYVPHCIAVIDLLVVTSTAFIGGECNLVPYIEEKYVLGIYFR